MLMLTLDYVTLECASVHADQKKEICCVRRTWAMVEHFAMVGFTCL